MRIRVRRVRQLPPSGPGPGDGPYRGAEFPLERTRDELHIDVARDATGPGLVGFAALFAVVMVVGTSPAAALGLLAVAAWMFAAAAFGRLRFRFRPGRIEHRATRVWTPLWRPTLRGTLTAVRVEGRKRDGRGPPTWRYTVVAETTQGSRALCASTDPAEAYAFAELVDRLLGLTPPSALPEPGLPEPVLPEPGLPEPGLPEPVLPEPVLPDAS